MLDTLSHLINGEAVGGDTGNVIARFPGTLSAAPPLFLCAHMDTVVPGEGVKPIVEGDRLVGVLTDRDIAVRVVAEGRDPEQVKVTEVASRDVVTLDPQQDLDEALRLMTRHQVRRLPVVEEDGRIVGILAQTDVAKEADEARTGEVVERISR